MSAHNRFLNDSGLTTNLSNITPQGEKNITNITDNHYLESSTQKIKNSYMPDLSISTVTVYADNATMQADLGNKQTGDVGIVTDEGSQTYMHDGTIWREIQHTDTLTSLNDVETSTAVQNDIMFYNVNQWINKSGPTNSQWNSIINLLNQPLATTDDVTFDGITASGHLALTSNAVPSPLNNSMMWQEGTTIKYRANNVTYDLGEIGLYNHTHTNKPNLDTIDQNMATSDNVIFNNITANNYFYLPTSIANPGLNYTLWRNTNDIWIQTGFVSYNLSTVCNDSVHSNRSNLDTINQNMATTDNVTHNVLTLNGGLTTYINQTGGVFSLGDLYYYGNEFFAVDASGAFNLRTNNIFDQNLNTTNNVTFNQTIISSGILGMGSVSANIIDTLSASIAIRKNGDPGIGIELDGTQADPKFRLYNAPGLNFADISIPADDILQFQMSDDVLNPIKMNLSTSTVEVKEIKSISGGIGVKNSGGADIMSIDSSGVMKLNALTCISGTTFYISNSTISANAVVIDLHPTTGYGSMRTANSINVGNNAVYASYMLQVNGTQGSSSASTFTVFSDERTKRDITTCDNSNILDAFENLRIVDYKHIYEDKTKRGIIANELKNCPCFGDCVGVKPGKTKLKKYDTNEEVELDDVYDFNPEKMIFSSFEAIKLLIKQNKEMMIRINALEAELGL